MSADGLAVITAALAAHPDSEEVIEAGRYVLQYVCHGAVRA